MSNIDPLAVDRHYGFGGIMEMIEVGLELAGKNLDSLTVDDLASIDEYHTRGRESTLEVVQLANLKASDLVLDVGCGLGGTARHLADQFKCNVVGIDLTQEYVSVGEPIKVLGLPAKGFPGLPYLDHTQYKTVALAHNSKKEKFEFSETNGFTAWIDASSGPTEE